MKKYMLRIGEKDYNATVLEIGNDSARIQVEENVYEVGIRDLGLNGIKPAQKSAPPVEEVKAPPAETASSGQSKAPISGDGIKAPMPGVVITVKVKEGERIKAGEHVLTIEAMKMENEIKAPYDGIVGKIHVAENDNVSEDELMVELKRPAMTTL